MRGPFALAIVLAVAALACAGRTTTGATTADGAASPIGSEGATNAAPCIDGNILASNYDQTCAVDTDCRLIAEGNACTPCAFNCANAVINMGALAQYTSDVANKPAVASEFNGQTCAAGCGNEIGPCCIGGKCQMGSQCGGSSEAASGPAACAAAGGRCLLGGPMGTCSKVGPQDCNPGRNPGGAFCCLALNDDVEDSGASEEGSSAPSDGAPGGDAETSCGSTTCQQGEVCVVDTASGGACRPPDDAGLCPSNTRFGGGCCSFFSITYSCKQRPSGCGATLSCACAESLCGAFCQSATGNEFDCLTPLP